MPTGYTSEIGEGISFKEFALLCARNFGACIMMRDESFDAKIPKEFKPSTYHEKEIKKTNKELKELKKMTIEEAGCRANEEYKNEINRFESAIKESNELRKKYESMLSKVKAWNPPTSDHNNLKEFMIKQITDSIEVDCGTDYYLSELKRIKLLTGIQWINRERKSLIKELDYNTKEDIAEKSRTAGRNNWIKELRKSLKD